MRRVTGLGGVFFKVKDPARIKQWYQEHLGMTMDDYGHSFQWLDPTKPDSKTPALTAWSPFSESSAYFAPSEKPFMFNYRVDNLETLIQVLKAEGVQVVGGIDEFPYGKFAWILDPEGNKIELWEPVDEGFAS